MRTSQKTLTLTRDESVRHVIHEISRSSSVSHHNSPKSIQKTDKTAIEMVDTLDTLSKPQVEFLHKLIGKYGLNDTIESEEMMFKVLIKTLKKSNDNLEIYLDKLEEL